MSVEATDGWSNLGAAGHGFVRSGLLLTGCVLAIAVPFFVFAIVTQRTGSAGPGGVAVAAAICLFAGLAAEAVGGLVHRAGSALGAMAAGMSLRLLPPLVVCMFLAMRGNGHQHLAFVVYLLTFYLATLALDTWLAVRRAAATPSNASKRST